MVVKTLKIKTVRLVFTRLCSDELVLDAVDSRAVYLVRQRSGALSASRDA